MKTYIQPEAESITSASVTDFAKNVVALAVGSIFVVVLLFLAVVAMSALGKVSSDSDET